MYAVIYAGTCLYIHAKPPVAVPCEYISSLSEFMSNKTSYLSEKSPMNYYSSRSPVADLHLISAVSKNGLKFQKAVPETS